MKIKKVVIIITILVLVIFVACGDKQNLNDNKENIDKNETNINEVNNIDNQNNAMNTDKNLSNLKNDVDENDKKNESESTNDLEKNENNKDIEIENDKQIEEKTKKEDEKENIRPEIIEEETIVEINNDKQEEKEIPVEVSTYFKLPNNNDRPVAIMIDNEGSRPYPQGGIEKAQIVYEMIAEHGATRLMPVFFGATEGKVGPVRSIRHYNIDFAIDHDSVLTHIGFSPLGRITLEENNFASINGVFNKFLWLFFDITDDPNNWQDTYTTFKNINKQITASGFRKELSKEPVFSYEKNELRKADVEYVKIPYSNYYFVKYEYDPKTKLYLRYRMDKYHKERYTNKVLAAKNIIIQKVNEYPIANDSAGRMDMDNVGSGEGYIISEGRMEDIEWSKSSRFTNTQYRYKEDGKDVLLNEGQTWIMIVSKDAKVKMK